MMELYNFNLSHKSIFIADYLIIAMTFILTKICEQLNDQAKLLSTLRFESSLRTEISMHVVNYEHSNYILRYIFISLSRKHLVHYNTLMIMNNYSRY